MAAEESACDLDMKEVAFRLANMAEALRSGHYMHAGLLYADVFDALNSPARSYIPADYQRTVELAHALWVAGEQLMVANFRGAK